MKHPITLNKIRDFSEFDFVGIILDNLSTQVNRLYNINLGLVIFRLFN